MILNENYNKKNIIFILSDDQGAWAMHCAGNDDIITPNLDRLADMGCQFDNFFCASPVCSPARASIITGKMPSSHGVHDWIGAGNMDTKKYPYMNYFYCFSFFLRFSLRAFSRLSKALIAERMNFIIEMSPEITATIIMTAYIQEGEPHFSTKIQDKSNPIPI